MPTLVFKIAADYDEVIKLRNEISKLEAQLKKMDVNKSPAAAKALETQLASTRQQMMGLVTEAAKTGAEMENGFKKKIYDASQTVNGLSEKIIAQRAVIKDIEFDVKRLGDAYRTALKNNPIGASGKLAEYNAARRALDEEKAALFGLTQQQAEARLSVKKLRDEYSLYKKEAGETVDVTKQIKQAVTDMGKKFLGGYGIKELVSQIVRVRGEFQSMQTAIETMVGKDMADSLMSQLKEMAKISPLTLTDMVDAEKMMLGFNIQAEDTVRYLQALSDISMGDSVKFKSLTLAFSQMSAAGKLMGQDLNQMINAGFNPLQIIAEKTGKSISTLKDEMSKGAVSAEMVQQAFIDATSAGGKFYQMSENASKTINGQLSMMQDALDNAFNEMGQASEGVIMEGIQLTTTLIQNYETVGKVLVGLVATYGAYRTAVMLATIATSKHTIAEVALTNARIIARKAQLLLNAAMLTNPYVAVATVITGLVATMWALSDSTTAAEKAQERFCQKSSEMKNKEEERKKSLESLISTINDETTATVARADALNKLKSEYPDIFKKYVDEKGHITDLIELWKEYNDQASVSSRESKQRMVENIDAQIAVTQNNLNAAKANSDWGSVKKYREQLESLQKERAKWVKEVLTDVNRELSVKEEAPKTYAEDYEQARKDWEEAKKELEKIEAEKDNFTSKQYEDAKKRVETTEKAYKKLGGLTGTALSKQQKEADKEKKSRQKLSDQLLALQEKNQQAEVNLMKEGTEKKLAQIDADYSAQKAAVDRQQRELAEANKEAGITSTNANGLTTDQQAEIDRANELATESRKKQIEDVYRAEAEAMRSYLAEYGTFQQQKLAISQEYADKIAKAQTNAEKIRLGKERDSKLSGIESNALKANIDWVTLFGEFGGMFSNMIKPALEDARKYMQTDEFKNSDASSQQAIVDAVNQMEKSLGGAGGLDFKKLGDDVQAYQNSVVSLNLAKEQEADALERLVTAQEEYENALKNGTEEQKNAAKETLANAQSNADLASANVQMQSENVEKAQKGMSETATALKANMDNVVQGLQQITSGGLTNIYNGLIQAGKGVGGAAGKLADSLESVPVVGWILSIIDIFKDGISIVISGLLDSVFSAVSGIIEDVLSGDLFVSIGESLMKGIGSIFDATSFGGFSKLTSIGSNAKEVQEAIDRLTDRNEALQGSIDALNDTIKAGRGAISVDAARKAVKYQDEQNANYLKIAQEQARYSGNHHSWNYYWGGFTQSQINDFSNQIGRNWNGSLWDLSPEEMKLLKGNVDMWTQIQNTGKGGYGGRLTEKLDDYIEQAGKIEELETQLNESLTGMTFDSMYDSFIDTLMDMDASAEDFADNMSEYFMRAMLSNKIGELYYDKLNEWYEDFAKRMEDGALDDNELDYLQGKWNGIVSDAIKERDDIASAVGYDNKETQEQQSASSRGFGTEMTHEDAGELSGRFTAVYESNLRIETAEQQQTVAITELRGSISALTAQATGMYNIADETRTILANSYLELQQIRENTGEIIKPIKQMQVDIAEVKRNTARL